MSDLNTLTGGEQLDNWIDGLLQNISPAQRQLILRKLAFALRKRMQKRIRDQRNPDGSAFEKRKKGKAKMFKKLGRKMQHTATADTAQVGFSAGLMSKVASVHQFGETTAVTKGGTNYTFPIRALLGLNDEDKQFIQDTLLEMLA